MKRIIVVLLLLILTACSTSPTGDTAASSPAEAATSAAQPAPTATVRLVLIATDPAAFKQAAGRPQLVEFFAFW